MNWMGCVQRSKRSLYMKSRRIRTRAEEGKTRREEAASGAGRGSDIYPGRPLPHLSLSSLPPFSLYLCSSYLHLVYTPTHREHFSRLIGCALSYAHSAFMRAQFRCNTQKSFQCNPCYNIPSTVCSVLDTISATL